MVTRRCARCWSPDQLATLDYVPPSTTWWSTGPKVLGCLPNRVPVTTRRCRIRCLANLRHQYLALPYPPDDRGSTTSTKTSNSARCCSPNRRFCSGSIDSGDGVDSNDDDGDDDDVAAGAVVETGATMDYSRYDSVDYRIENHRYRYPVPPRRSLGAQGSRGRGNQDSTRDPLYCRGCCNRQRPRGDL